MNWSFPVHTSLRFQATFRNSSYAVADPTDIILTIMSLRDSISSTFKYSLAEVNKESTGIYYVEYTPDMPGSWEGIWRGTGNLVAQNTFKFAIT